MVHKTLMNINHEYLVLDPDNLKDFNSGQPPFVSDKWENASTTKI